MVWMLERRTVRVRITAVTAVAIAIARRAGQVAGQVLERNRIKNRTKIQEVNSNKKIGRSC
jgi:hypothetical protein